MLYLRDIPEAACSMYTRGPMGYISTSWKPRTRRTLYHWRKLSVHNSQLIQHFHSAGPSWPLTDRKEDPEDGNYLPLEDSRDSEDDLNEDKEEEEDDDDDEEIHVT